MSICLHAKIKKNIYFLPIELNFWNQPTILISLKRFSKAQKTKFSNAQIQRPVKVKVWGDEGTIQIRFLNFDSSTRLKHNSKGEVLSCFLLINLQLQVCLQFPKSSTECSKQHILDKYVTFPSFSNIDNFCSLLAILGRGFFGF